MSREKSTCNIRKTHDDIERKKYDNLLCAVERYKVNGLFTAERFSKLAEQLTNASGNSMRSRRAVKITQAVGGSTAVAASIAGMSIASPMLLPAMLVGSSIAVGTQLDIVRRKRSFASLESDIRKKVSQLLEELKEEDERLQSAMEDLVGIDRNTLGTIGIINMVLEKMRADFSQTDEIEQDRKLFNTISKLKKDLTDFQSNYGSYFDKETLAVISSLLPPVGGIKQIFNSTSADSCSHSMFKKCDNGKKSNFACYGNLGKSVYVLTLVVNIVSTCVSAMEAEELRRKLNAFSEATTVQEKSLIVGGLSEELNYYGETLKDHFQSLNSIEY